METKKRFIPIIVVVSLAIGFGGGLTYERYENSKFNSTAAQDVDLSTFWQVWNLLHENYVDGNNLKTQDLLYGAISGLVDSLGDPYTVFFPPKESKEFAEHIQGNFGGVGIEIGIRDNALTVIAPIKDTPADKAGILAGDRILKIDEQETDGMNVNQAVTLIRGNRGTTIVLEIFRKGFSNTRKIPLTRDTINIPAATWKLLNGNIAHLEVSVFNQNVDRQFQKAAVEITKSNADRIILDLRNNPGGLLDSAVNLAEYFLDENQTVTIEREGNSKETYFRTSKNALLRNYPVIVLINKGSASASEILAGTLRDNKNVTIVGETSFGKGSIQDVFELPRGSSVKITFAKWFTPNGTSINENGIKPDVEVTITEEDDGADRDPQLDRAIELIKNL